MSQESTTTADTRDGNPQPLFWYQTTGGDSPSPLVRQQSDSSTDTIQPSTSTEPKLCGEQQYIVDLIARGRNVFFTGSAGCGKSTVLKAALNRLREESPLSNVCVLAPTGHAALQINGMTTWSYMGWTPDYHKLPIEELKNQGWRRHVQDRLRKTDILVINEISMIENHYFERINVCMCR
ncbi:ATP-dependent DNA helicase PIF1 [Ophiocordyceps camponoti-floridani]|uniref:ATP-dependent DNA helicase n=1 Tax=Ophiocordyceps camponoti-floridani TaxID=2030778 RepID=A0A8H4VBT2_9HYPO|nr:ATP-dependent DNA helicase PIF1 [Ophiocordyceps camponoti-floridani]